MKTAVFCDDCSIRRTSNARFDEIMKPLKRGKTYYEHTNGTYGVYMYPVTGDDADVDAAWAAFHSGTNNVDLIFGRGRCHCIPPFNKP